MILMREDFKYPNKDEIVEIYNDIPTVISFGFKNIKKAEIFLGGLSNMDVQRIDHLFWWDYHLGNRLGRLRQTFEYILVHYKRGISKINNPRSFSILLNELRSYFKSDKNYNNYLFD